MNPGRELDALIAEKVMGLKPCADKLGKCDGAKMVPVQCWGNGGNGSELLPYSTDIAAAWEVWIKVGRDFCISLTKRMGCNGWVWDANINGEAFATSASSSNAICLAALKAVGG